MGANLMGYVDHIGAFHYKGRTIEAHVTRLQAPRQKDRQMPIWTVDVDGERFGLFPASPGDTEEDIRERIKQWVDQHLKG